MSSFRRRLLESIPKYIQFKDSNTKAICVANWGSNGEITYTQAAAVTTIGDKFKGNTTITSFDELKYFTGLTSWSTAYYNTFYGCTSLTSVVFPKCSLTTIPSNSMNNCYALKSVTIPEGYTFLGGTCMGACSISDIVLPSTINTIEQTPFYGNKVAIKVRMLSTAVPKIQNETYLGYVGNGIALYVLDNLVDAYKAVLTSMTSSIYPISQYIA